MTYYMIGHLLGWTSTKRHTCLPRAHMRRFWRSMLTRLVRVRLLVFVCMSPGPGASRVTCRHRPRTPTPAARHTHPFITAPTTHNTHCRAHHACSVTVTSGCVRASCGSGRHPGCGDIPYSVSGNRPDPCTCTSHIHQPHTLSLYAGGSISHCYQWWVQDAAHHLPTLPPHSHPTVPTRATNSSQKPPPSRQQDTVPQRSCGSSRARANNGEEGSRGVW